MDGAALLQYVQRRLAIDGVAQDQFDDATLYEAITEARDEIKRAFSLAAPVVVQELVVLEEDGSDDRVFALPAATADPMRCLVLRSVTGETELTPAAFLNQDNGHFEWINVRSIRLADYTNPPGGIEGYFVLDSPAITAATTEDEVGLPTPTHTAIGKWASVLALSMGEDLDPSNHIGLFNREMQKLENMYSSYFEMDGVRFREAFLLAYGDQYPDSLY